MSKACPKCKREIKDYDEVEELYGSPLMICETCKSECLSNKREIALSGVSFCDRTLIRMRSLIILAVGLCIWCIIISEVKEGRTLEVILEFVRPSLMGGIAGLIGTLIGAFFLLLSIPAGIWSIIDDIRTYRKRLEFFKREKQASIERCSNLEYMNKLVSLGYKITKCVK